MEEALADEQFRVRGVFNEQLTSKSGDTIPAVPIPIINDLRKQSYRSRAPTLGEHNEEFLQ